MDLEDLVRACVCVCSFERLHVVAGADLTSCSVCVSKHASMHVVMCI